MRNEAFDEIFATELEGLVRADWRLERAARVVAKAEEFVCVTSHAWFSVLWHSRQHLLGEMQFLLARRQHVPDDVRELLLSAHRELGLEQTLRSTIVEDSSAHELIEGLLGDSARWAFMNKNVAHRWWWTLGVHRGGRGDHAIARPRGRTRLPGT